MAPSFPTSVKTFTSKTNNVDTIDASHVNDLQDEVTQVETLLGASSTRRTTFTPTFSAATSAPSTVGYGTSNGGYYAQFGSVVFISCVIDVANFTGGSGNIVIGGFPVVAPVISQSVGGAARGVSGFSGSWPTQWVMNASTSAASLLSTSSGAAFSILSISNVSTAGFQVRFSGFYLT